MSRGQLRALERAEWPEGTSVSDVDVDALQQARHADPFSVLGFHQLKTVQAPEVTGSKAPLWVVRVWHPALERDWEAEGKQAVLHPREWSPTSPGFPLTRRAACLYEVVLEGMLVFAAPEALDSMPWVYEVSVGERRFFDAYALGRAPVLLDIDIEQFHSGIFPDVADVMGCHVVQGPDGVFGLAFTVWAPRAAAASVVADWNGWDRRASPMRRRMMSGHFVGLWELFLPFGRWPADVPVGSHYGFRLLTHDGGDIVRIDPFAQEFEVPPHEVHSAPHTNSSKVPRCDDAFRADPFAWKDAEWLQERERLGRSGLIVQQPMSIYEVHLPSWRRGADGAMLSYRDLAPLLLEHVQRLNFTHVELMGLAHHPYYGSWGYQVAGYYGVCSLLGSPDDLKFLIDTLHGGQIGVIMDFVPAHFCKDACSIADFDGTPTFEYDDPREGVQKDWGTKVFNFRKHEVRSFLIGAALFWAKRYHVDGFRCDAVSSMIYRNFCSRRGFRPEDEWVKNEHGGNANLEAVSFLRDLNRLMHRTFPGILMMAEESHAWGGVTWEDAEHPGGLGFDFKWDLGWMNDTLTYLELPAGDRPKHHSKLTCRQLRAERWVCPLSHDEVTHSKGSLLSKMGRHENLDFYDRVRLLAALLGYQVGTVGRPLIFMGTEYAQGPEWNHKQSLDWHEMEQPLRQQFSVWLSDLLAVYKHHLPLHAGDDGRGFASFEGSFEWVESNAEACVLAFVRRWRRERPVLAVVNFGWQTHRNYVLRSPHYGEWEVLLNSDDRRYGGRGHGPGNLARLWTHPGGLEGWSDCLTLDVPAQGCLFLLGPASPDQCVATGDRGRVLSMEHTVRVGGAESDSAPFYYDDAFEYGFT